MLRPPSRLAPPRPARRRSWHDEPEPEEKGFCEKCHRLQQKFSLLVGLLAGLVAFLVLTGQRPALAAPLTQLLAFLVLSAAGMFAASRFYAGGKPVWFWPCYGIALATLVFGVVFFIFDYAAVICGGPAANPFAVIVARGC